MRRARASLTAAAAAAAVLLGSSGCDALHHARHDVPEGFAPAARRPLEASLPGTGHALRGAAGPHNRRTKPGIGEGVLRAPERERIQATSCRGGGGEDFVGGDEFYVDVEGGDVESTMANVENTAERAFMPRAFRRTNSWSGEEGKSVAQRAGAILRDVTQIDLRGHYAWFYPDPPWGRKDVFRRGSRVLQIWHVVVWIAMAHVALVVPYRLAGFDSDSVFLPQESSSVLFDCNKSARSRVDLLVDCIFALDMVFSARTAFYKPKGSGRLILVDDLHMVQKHYLGSREFALDLAGIVPLTDVLCLVAGYAEKTWTRSFSLSLVNFSKLLRLAKLLRLHHFRQMWRYIGRMFSHRARALELLKLLMILALVSHLWSCAWYWVGCQQQGGWVPLHLAITDHWLDRYMAAFYFMASTMTTVGYGDITALTVFEKVFCVWACVMGSFLFGAIVGTIPRIIQPRKMAATRYEDLERNVREYFQEHKVPRELRGNIIQYYEYRFPDRKLYDLQKVLSELPRSIQEDLVVHVYRDVIRASPCLQRLRSSALGDVCLRLQQEYAARGDQIIRGGAEPDGIYFIRAGQVLVTRGGETVRILKQGDAFGENCLIDPDLQDQPVLVHGMTALEPVEMVKLELDDLELMLANHDDFILTATGRDWPPVKAVMIERWRNRMTRLESSTLEATVHALLGEVATIKKLHAHIAENVHASTGGAGRVAGRPQRDESCSYADEPWGGAAGEQGSPHASDCQTPPAKPKTCGRSTTPNRGLLDLTLSDRAYSRELSFHPPQPPPAPDGSRKVSCVVKLSSPRGRRLPSESPFERLARRRGGSEGSLPDIVDQDQESSPR